MNALPGFYFSIERSGASAFLDPQETISFRRAEGYYVAPDRAQATVRVIAPGFVTDVNVISIDEIQWETDLLTNQWNRLPPNWGFNPAVLFDAQIGIQSILTADLIELELMGSEKLEDGPDGKLYLLGGKLDGTRIYDMSYRLIGPETMSVQLWIVPETFELARAIVTDPNEAGAEATVWTVDFSQFGQVVEIVPPAEGS